MVDCIDMMSKRCSELEGYMLCWFFELWFSRNWCLRLKCCVIQCYREFCISRFSISVHSSFEFLASLPKCVLDDAVINMRWWIFIKLKWCGMVKDSELCHTAVVFFVITWLVAGFWLMVWRDKLVFILWF